MINDQACPSACLRPRPQWLRTDCEKGPLVSSSSSFPAFRRCPRQDQACNQRVSVCARSALRLEREGCSLHRLSSIGGLDCGSILGPCSSDPIPLISSSTTHLCCF